MKAKLPIFTVALMTLALMSPAAAASGTGTVTIQIQGYGTVQGQLENAVIQADNSVAMSMLVNDQLQTSQGSFPLQATGEWSGNMSNSTLSGTIHDVQGKIHVCVIFSCNDVDFAGNGNWTGQLQNGSAGSGSFTGTMTVTNSPYPQIPQGQAIPIYGSWAADFTSSIPEFNSKLSVLTFTILTVAMILARRKMETAKGIGQVST
jgi:hypothetical protein